MPAHSAKHPTPPIDYEVDLESLDRAAVNALWKGMFGRPLPPRMKRSLAANLLQYEFQAVQHGGLSKGAERFLTTLLPKPSNSGKATPPRGLKPGTRLLRTWRGQTHVVTVVEPGFIYDGVTYNSLSVIARAITGTAWSGPAFFGLVKQRSSKSAP